MKKVQQYHIQYYWQVEADKKERADKIKKKAFEIFIVGAFFVLNIAIGYEFLNLIFG